MGLVDYPSFMNTLQQVSADNGVTASVVHLMLKDGPAELKPEEPERMIEERATKLGPVLEGILLESHGRLHWGINE